MKPASVTQSRGVAGPSLHTGGDCAPSRSVSVSMGAIDVPAAANRPPSGVVHTLLGAGVAAAASLTTVILEASP